MATVGLAAFSCAFPDYRFEAQSNETCDNGAIDGSETGVDCGGSCDPCPCSGSGGCPEQGQVCVDGTCLEPCEGEACGPACDDGDHNGDETDIDCGGSCDKCKVGDSCLSATDCVDGVCEQEVEGKLCQPPACTDGVQNGGEAWIDCDADCPTQCENNQPCDVDADCKSDTCVDQKCVRPLCDNDFADPDETDVDCGGSESGCKRCEVGQDCQEGGDCVEHVCGENGECAEPSCDDEAHNGDETDEDCGGPTTCDRCGEGEACDEGSDCEDQICNSDGECEPPACDDEFTNGDESDLNCGGKCDPCQLGDRCNTDNDCVTNICNLGTEAPAECVSCEDGKLNGSELGKDCGGSDCELCKPGAMCTADEGCVNYLCDDGSCETGLELDYSCDQCGNQTVNDKISYIITLRNLTSEAINVSDVQIRYYLDAEITENLSFECTYQGTSSCGTTRLRPSGFANSPTATHYVETMVGSTAKIQGGGSATVTVSLLLGGRVMDQADDYSFSKDRPQLNYQRITLHRAGSLIWGSLPE